MAVRIEFKSKDGVDIVGDHYEPEKASSKGVVLVHMMPATRKSWAEFASKLQAADHHVLAIDLRGHGDSGGGDYRNFSDKEHQASILDLEAAADFFIEKKITQIGFAGASIGANLSLQYLAEKPETKVAILLSPGIDYRGIEIQPLAEKIAEKNKILFVGAEDDSGTMGGSCEELSKALGNPPKICYERGGHGTNLFQSHPDLMGKIIEFLEARF